MALQMFLIGDSHDPATTGCTSEGRQGLQSNIWSPVGAHPDVGQSCLVQIMAGVSGRLLSHPLLQDSIKGRCQSLIPLPFPKLSPPHACHKFAC